MTFREQPAQMSAIGPRADAPADDFRGSYWPLAAARIGDFRGSFRGQSGRAFHSGARQLLTHNVTLPRLTNNFLFKDRCALPDQMSFVLTFARRAFVLAMRNRDRTNLDEIAIFGLSVTPKDFPHNMLPGRRPKLRVASHPRSARRSCPGPARCFFGGCQEPVLHSTLLQRTSPFLAQSGHSGGPNQCPLSA
jgi:hypothetical protein